MKKHIVIAAAALLSSSVFAQTTFGALHMPEEKVFGFCAETSHLAHKAKEAQKWNPVTNYQTLTRIEAAPPAVQRDALLHTIILGMQSPEYQTAYEVDKMAYVDCMQMFAQASSTGGVWYNPTSDRMEGVK